MKRLLIVIAVTIYSGALRAQPAALEMAGVMMGERTEPFVALQDQLKLYKRPDLDSEMVVIPYQKGWRIPVSARDGLTRVLSIGELRVTRPDNRMVCSVKPTEGPETLVPGEVVEYLRYVGEGFGDIRFRGAQCQAEVAPSLGHFDLASSPMVQLWLPVYYADGTSPGWLLHDGKQAH